MAHQPALLYAEDSRIIAIIIYRRSSYRTRINDPCVLMFLALRWNQI